MKFAIEENKNRQNLPIECLKLRSGRQRHDAPSNLKTILSKIRQFLKATNLFNWSSHKQVPFFFFYFVHGEILVDTPPLRQQESSVGQASTWNRYNCKYRIYVLLMTKR